MILENLLSRFAESISYYFPGSVLNSFALGGTSDLSYSAAAIIASFYGIACVIITYLLFIKRDVTD